MGIPSEKSSIVKWQYPFLVVVVSEAGVLQLLHQLVLFLLPLGELGQDLAHRGDGESVGHGPEQESGVVWGLELVVTRKAGLGGDQGPVARN